MLRRILDQKQDVILAEERRLLGELAVALARFDAAADDQLALERSVRQLDELFLLVVAGEFNAGKSAFVNALLGSRVLEEGVTPTTTRVQILKHGPTVSRTTTEAALDVVTAPVDLLLEINIVDTPGTNAIHREHEAITRDFVPRSDLVLFVTSADRPFTESERAFLQGIREWGKKIVLVINKIDILESPAELETVRAFVADNGKILLGSAPEIFAVSARKALRAKESAKDSDSPDRAALLAESQFPPLEKAIVETLDEQERVRLKLLNPLGVGALLADRTLTLVTGRLGLLEEDVRTLQDIESQLGLYKEDMEREFRLRLSDVDRVLREFESRGMEFFDDTVRLARFVDLLNKDRMKAEFERRVVADVPQAIERRVQELIDWLVAADLKQWQAVTEHLAKRRAQHADRIVGRAGAAFDYDRNRLLDSVGRETQRTMESYDKDAESSRLAESVQAAVAGTALVGVGAIGLGALLTHIAVTAAADVTGILAAGMVAALGLLILPHRRQRAKAELKVRIEVLRTQLLTALTTQFEREIARSLSRIDDAVAPYTRFVRAERDQLTRTRDEIQTLADELAKLKVQVEGL